MTCPFAAVANHLTEFRNIGSTASAANAASDGGVILRCGPRQEGFAETGVVLLALSGARG
jgi:hypothetical protein